MKQKKKIVITILMAFILMFSNFSSALPMSVYAQDGTLVDTMLESGSADTTITGNVSDDESTKKYDGDTDIGKISENIDKGIVIEKQAESNITTIANDTVVTVDGKGYSSLEEAIKSIKDTGTVKIVSDINLSDSIMIPENVTVTLTSDKNPHTIKMISTGDARNQSVFVVEKKGSLIINSDNITVTRDSEPANIYTSGLVLCYGKFDLEKGILDGNGNSINDSNNNLYSHGIVQVCGSEAIFTMNGGKIKNAKTFYNAAGIRVCCNGRFIMNDGIISDIHGGGQLNTGAVLVVADNNDFFELVGSANFEMNGGIIENNTGYRGAGVYVIGVEYNNRATMIMNGGKIHNNICTGWYSNQSFKGAGAGIYIEKNAFVTMNGGSVSNNIVNGGMGGGIATADAYYDTFPGGPSSSGAWAIENYSRYYPAGFTMNGGTVSNNKATMNSVGGDGGCGGGIYSASNTVKLKGGVIEDNEAEKQGGGVYVSSIPYELTIYDALVTGNVASILGGGVWACPTGDTEVFVTNGVGIYDNTTTGAGDDVVSVKTIGKNYALTLANRILGGGQVLWYKDGGIKDNAGDLGNPDGSLRYASNDTPILEIKNSTDPYALKAIVSDNAKKLAEKNAKLFIRNNKSARGGGIGTNGGIVMGEKDNEYVLKVKKSWKDTDERLKRPVTVYLKVGDTVLDPVTLSKDNNWEAKFKDLPNPDTLEDVSFAVVEDLVPDNFTVEYQEAIVDKDNRIITIDVMNTYHAPKVGDITVEKEVTGMHGEKDKEFHFTVTLTDKTVNGTYGEMNFTEGVAKIALKHGEKVTAIGLPAGIGYIVVEKEANSDGYTTSFSTNQGTVLENSNAKVKFINHKEVKSDKPFTPDKPRNPENPNTPENSNTPDNPKTGDGTNIGLDASLLATSFLLFVAVLVLRRKQRLIK